MVEHEFLERVLADRGGVVFIVDKVFHLATLHVDDIDAIVVGSQPDPAMLIHAHVPHLQVGRQRGNAILRQELVERGIPLLILLVVHIHLTARDHPVVAVFIHIAVVGLTGGTAMLAHEIILEQDLALIAIDDHDITIGRGHEQFIVPLGKAREVVLLGNLVLLVAILDELVGFLAGVIAIQTLVVGLDPETFLRVDIQAVDITLDAPFGQDKLGVAGDLLGEGIEHTVVHALLEPQHAVGILPDTIHQVVAQGGGIGGIRIIDTEAVAVVTVETVGRTNPDKATRILEQVVDLRV